MKRKDVLVIRIGLSIESADDNQVALTIEPNTETAESPTTSEKATPSRAPQVPQTPLRRTFGRGDSPRDSELGDKRAMTDMQRKALFRIAYDLGDKESALGIILEALGVKRLEWATRADASRAISLLGARRKNGTPQRSNGAGHD